MTNVRTFEVSDSEADIRLDRWFKRRLPGLAHGHLERLLRTGQIRLDGARAKSGQRLAPGQRIRVPPLAKAGARRHKPEIPVSSTDAADLRHRVLYRDPDVIALDKPPGLAVQGGSKTLRHLDAMLDALRFEAKAAGNLTRRLRVLAHPALLVVDEIGYMPVNQDGAVLFFQIINARHERASTVLTSNKGFEDWGGVLGDEVMAAALIDRLSGRKIALAFESRVGLDSFSKTGFSLGCAADSDLRKSEPGLKLAGGGIVPGLLDFTLVT